jgi:hypothetical protein
MSKKPAPPSQKRPPAAARTLGSFVPALTRKAFEKYGFSAATLITDWPAIVGHDLARQTAPEKLKWPRPPEIPAGDTVAPAAKARGGATLFMRVEGPRALEIEYKRAHIAERINAYFGYRAIADIRIIQAPLPKPKLKSRIEITPADKVALPTVTDDDLRQALEKLGAGIRAKKRTAKSD